MRKMVIFLFLSFLLVGCGAVSVPPHHPVVTAITIRETTAKPETTMQFSTDSETAQVLTYLRLMDIRGEAQVNPEYAEGAMYEFHIFYSDGSVSTLRQKGDHYFMGADGQWLEIAPYSGKRLTRIINNMD